MGAVKRSIAILAGVCAFLSLGLARAQEGGEIPLLHASTDIEDLASLQRGARNFMDYCSGCHSMQYLRYNRMGHDLGIPPADLAAHLMFTSDKPFDPIVSAMPDQEAVAWFGKQVPDLTLIARERGKDYLYSYLKGFYDDNTRQWGVNNIYLPNVAMPHVLVELQGQQKPVFKNVPDASGNAHLVLVGVEPMSPGTLSTEEYDRFVRDTVNFLDYASEPVKAKREMLGLLVTPFLIAGFVLMWLLKREYWKDVH